jgi:hypothetical protein
MKKHFICLLLVYLPLLFISGNLQAQDRYAALKDGFADPQGTARPKVYWWWLNGYTDTVRLKQELKAIKDAGLGGVDLFEIGVPPFNNPDGMVKAGPAFMSEASLEAIGLALEEAGKLGLEIGLNLASSWNAGGAWVTPEHAAKTLYHSRINIKGGEPVKVELPFPEIVDNNGTPRKIEYTASGGPVYYEEVSIVALPASEKSLSDTTKILNLTAQFDAKSQILTWDTPQGDWEVYRFISSNSGEQLLRPSENSAGPILDHFDSTATRMHLMYFIERLMPLVGDLKQSALKYLYLASYEAKDFAWTSTFPEAFKKLNGYEVYPFLPGLVHPERYDEELLRRFSHDYSETFSELMINNHYAKAKEICNDYGLQIISESGGPGHMHHIPVESMKALGALDVPRGEFWYERPYYDEDSVDMVWLVKEIAAAANIYQKDIVEQESFTSYKDWQESPADLKRYADRAFAEGMNRLVIHGFTHSPREYGYPGIAYFAGTHFNDKRVWWPKVKPFNDYLARVSYVLQNTDFVSDVLYYYGEEIPNLVPPKNTRFMVGAGYDYEMINTEILINHLKVDKGDLVLHDKFRYSVLYVDDEELSLQTLEKLKELAGQGARIVGRKPVRAIGLPPVGEDQKVADLAEEIWKTSPTKESYSLGGVYSEISPLEVLKGLGVPPDFDYKDNHPDQRIAPLDYIHYKTTEMDFYFVRNTTNEWVNRNCFFRQGNKIPEIWDPISGEVIPVSIYEQQGKQVMIPLSLPPYGSFFIAFKKGEPAEHFLYVDDSGDLPRIQYTAKGWINLDVQPLKLASREGIMTYENENEVLELEGEWTLEFVGGWGAPESTTIQELTSWTDIEEPGIRYYSGMATYHKDFEFQKANEGEKVYLDLGELAELAEVWINGQPLGNTWTKPHQFEITAIVKEGTNNLRVEVVNTWSNRLTGDAVLGEKFTKTNIAKANKNLIPWEELPLKKSGLLGPVRIVQVKEYIR